MKIILYFKQPACDSKYSSYIYTGRIYTKDLAVMYKPK